MASIAPLPAPVCPRCGAALSLEHDGSLDAWACPSGHGLAFTLSEAYERLDETTVHAIWNGAKVAAAGPRACPMCAAPMVTVVIAERGDLRLDVCAVDELIWFDAAELTTLPRPTPAAPPSVDEIAHLEAITDQFGDALSEQWAGIDRETLRDHLIHRVGPR